MDKMIKAFKALSDETRLRILNILLERECCVCEVMQALDISQTRASRNLGILENAGFLKSRRNGAWMYYSLVEEKSNEYIRSLIAMIGGFAPENRVLVDDRERLNNSVRLDLNCCKE